VVAEGFGREAIERLASAAGPAGAGMVIGAMIDSAPRLVDGLQKALASGDSKEFRRYAHSLKANAMTVGADGTAAILQELEDLGGAGRLDEVDEKAASAAQSYRTLVESLQELRKHYSG
jgi:HPt (histidine-containing phosphotransfer) domain-containing protein